MHFSNPLPLFSRASFHSLSELGVRILSISQTQLCIFVCVYVHVFPHLRVCFIYKCVVAGLTSPLHALKPTKILI